MGKSPRLIRQLLAPSPHYRAPPHAMNALDSDAELPKNHVKRIVKSKLAELLGEEASDTRKQLALNKDALLAFSESARVFVWYVTSTANDICRQSKRQTVGAEDVLRALDDLEFGEFVPQLKDALEGEQLQSVKLWLISLLRVKPSKCSALGFCLGLPWGETCLVVL